LRNGMLITMASMLLLALTLILRGCTGVGAESTFG